MSNMAKKLKSLLSSVPNKGRPGNSDQHLETKCRPPSAFQKQNVGLQKFKTLQFFV